MEELLTPESVLKRLKQSGFRSKKGLGQHFLVDEKALDTIIEKSGLTAEDTVVEVGPGMGVLTRRLLAITEKVVAFEYDPEMMSILLTDLPKLEIVAGDVLQTAAERVSKIDKYKVVANIPYQITTPLMKLFLEGGVDHAPTSMTLLVQKEVGKRLAAAARTSDRGYLSVLAQYYAEVEYCRDVPASSFFPAPKVDSAVIHLQIREKRMAEMSKERDFLKFVKTRFVNPRKQLRNVMAGIRGVSTSEVSEYFEKMGLASNVRAQELTLEDWYALYTNPMV